MSAGYLVVYEVRPPVAFERSIVRLSFWIKRDVFTPTVGLLNLFHPSIPTEIKISVTLHQRDALVRSDLGEPFEVRESPRIPIKAWGPQFFIILCALRRPMLLVAFRLSWSDCKVCSRIMYSVGAIS